MVAAVRIHSLLAACLLTVVAGCERLGIPDPEKQAAQKEADGRAVGAGCRHSGRPIEDCYKLNPKALKAAVFAGWKDMNDYMIENKIQTAAADQRQTAEEPEQASGDKSTGKHDAPGEKPDREHKAASH
ncbi:MAG TPA: hypothetical protein PKC22_01430 [Rhodocyclaceae bacterium]|nr:hypothetical protein [Rhodocyclaceae bacterium]